MHKLHRLIDLLIHNIQGSTEIAFVSPEVEATGHALEFLQQFKNISFGEHAADLNQLTRMIAEAKMHFGNGNQRLKNFIADPSNSQTVVFNVFTSLKDSTVPEAKRLRNEQLMRLFVMMNMVSRQFPAVPNEMGYFHFLSRCEQTIEHLVKAFKAVLLFALPALEEALHMPEKELQKKLSQIPARPYPSKGGGPSGGGGPPPYPPKAGGRNPKGNPNGNPKGNPTGNPKGNPINPFDPKIKKRDHAGNLKGNQKSSSTGDTDDSAGMPPPQGAPVPCNSCGGAHSASSHAQHPTDFSCPFIRLKHPRANKGTGEFLASDNGKQYNNHPWDLEDRTTKVKTPQKRLKFGQILENGTYVDLPMDHTAASKGDNPVSFIAQINNTHNTHYNPFMTITVPSLNSHNREGERQRKRKVGEGSVSTVKERQVTSALIDTGALDSDYISSTLAEYLVHLGYVYDKSKLDSMHTPFTNIPSVARKGHMSLNIKIYNELTKTKDVIPLNARIIDSPIDIIIGRPTITQHKLLRKCHDQILSDTRLINYDHSPLSGE